MTTSYTSRRRKPTQKYDQEQLSKRLRMSLLGIFGFLLGGLLILNFFGSEIGALLGFVSIHKNDEDTIADVTVNPPSFADLPKATNQDTINIEGYAAPGSTVKIFVNGPEKGEVIADAEGKFMFENIFLIESRNTVFAKSVDEKGHESEKSETQIIMVDNSKPDIDIESPKPGDTIKNLNERVLIRGKVSEKAKITINKKLVVQKPDLTFEYLLGVVEGDVKITVEAVDEAGNSKIEAFNIKYQKESE